MYDKIHYKLKKRKKEKKEILKSKKKNKKCCIQYGRKFGKVGSGHSTGRKSDFIPIPKRGNAKERSNYCTIALISHASKAMLTILQARLQ